MKFCTNCGLNMEDNERFCPECGHDNGIVDSTTGEGELTKLLPKILPKINAVSILSWASAILFAFAAIGQVASCLDAARVATVQMILVDKWIALAFMAGYYILGLWSIVCAAGIIFGKGKKRGKSMAASVVLIAEILILKIAHPLIGAIGISKTLTDILGLYLVGKTVSAIVICALSIAAAVFAGRMAKKSGEAPTAEIKNKFMLKLRGKIKTIVFVLAAFAAVFNTLAVYLDTYEVKLYDEHTSGNSVICETEKYIYYLDNGLCRVDKTTHATEKATRKDSTIIAAEADGIYYRTDSGILYHVSDTETKVTEIGNVYGTYAFMDGIYHYALNSDGSVFRYLNSDSGKYSNYSKQIAASGDYQVNRAVLYGGCIYAYMSSNAYSLDDSDRFVSEGYKLVRISLLTGKTSTLFEKQINNFIISDGKIYINAYGDTRGLLYTMNTDGSESEELTDLPIYNGTTLAAKDNYIYYLGSYAKPNSSTGKITSVRALLRYNLESDALTMLAETGTDNLTMYSTSNYLFYYYGDSIRLYDYNGNRITSNTSST